MNYECSINKNKQVVGNPAFVISTAGKKGPNKAHHMFCTKCEHEYFQSMYATGRAKCPKCSDGSGATIPPGATVIPSQIRKGEYLKNDAKVWLLVKPRHGAVGDITTNELLEGDDIPDGWTSEDIPTSEPVWSPADIVMEDEGLVLQSQAYEHMVATPEDIDVAAELARTTFLEGLSAQFKGWEETGEANREIWRHVTREMISVFGIEISEGE